MVTELLQLQFVTIYLSGASDKGKGKAPTFVSKPTIQQGDNSLILKCQVDCSPAPQVRIKYISEYFIGQN